MNTDLIMVTALYLGLVIASAVVIYAIDLRLTCRRVWRPRKPR